MNAWLPHTVELIPCGVVYIKFYTSWDDMRLLGRGNFVDIKYYPSITAAQLDYPRDTPVGRSLCVIQGAAPRTSLFLHAGPDSYPELMRD